MKTDKPNKYIGSGAKAVPGEPMDGGPETEAIEILTRLTLRWKVRMLPKSAAHTVRRAVYHDRDVPSSAKCIRDFLCCVGASAARISSRDPWNDLLGIPTETEGGRDGRAVILGRLCLPDGRSLYLQVTVSKGPAPGPLPQLPGEGTCWVEITVPDFQTFYTWFAASRKGKGGKAP